TPHVAIRVADRSPELDDVFSPLPRQIDHGVVLNGEEVDQPFLFVLENTAGVAYRTARLVDLRLHRFELVRLFLEVDRIPVGLIGAALDDQFQDGNLFEEPEIALPVATNALQRVFEEADEGVRLLDGEKLGVHANSLASGRTPTSATRTVPYKPLKLPNT